jgi:hypothetical protein
MAGFTDLTIAPSTVRCEVVLRLGNGIGSHGETGRNQGNRQSHYFLNVSHIHSP